LKGLFILKKLMSSTKLFLQLMSNQDCFSTNSFFCSPWESAAFFKKKALLAPRQTDPSAADVL
jgi:hypothetical protein